MRRFVIGTLELLATVGVLGCIAFGALVGYQTAEGVRLTGGGGDLPPLPFQVSPGAGAVTGALVGFLGGTVLFGVLFLLVDIAENARRTRELLEAEARRQRAP